MSRLLAPASHLKVLLLPLLLVAMTGCSSVYTLPGKGVNFKEIGIPGSPKDPANQSLRSQTKFPASLILVRLQGPRYENRTVQTYGNGSFCVVMTRDPAVEKPDQLDLLGHMPLISGVDNLRKLDLPESPENVQQLRNAAQAEDGDILLIYTFDDTFTNSANDTMADFTLGLAATNNFVVSTTASAVLMDARTGLVYGSMEAIAQKKGAAGANAFAGAADAARSEVEAQAFEDLCVKTKRAWNIALKQYAPPSATTMP